MKTEITFKAVYLTLFEIILGLERLGRIADPVIAVEKKSVSNKYSITIKVEFLCKYISPIE